MTVGLRSTRDEPSIAAGPWVERVDLPGTGTNTEETGLNLPIGSAASAPTVEETIRFAAAHYDRALRRLAD